MTDAAVLALADGTLFRGVSIGVPGQAVGEVVFNTAMSGYQEILTDPSYYQQLVTLTYPHIGNVGANVQDMESDRVYAAGLIVRDMPRKLSNWRAEGSLADYLRRNQVVAIAGIDTRRLTRLLREQGAQNGCIMAGAADETAAVVAAQACPGLRGVDLVRVVSTSEPYEWGEGAWRPEADADAGAVAVQGLAVSPQVPAFAVVAYDYGVKRNILRLLHEYGCRVRVVPADTPAREVLAMQPDGVFLSNGPGDPEPCDYAVAAIREVIAHRTPVFGICLGHQLLGLAAGAHTRKMKFGHHGANHPVKDLKTGKVLISSQNHGFEVEETSLPEHVEATHRSLFDQSLQGIHYKDRPAFGFQGHPEASPGPQDLRPLFTHFVDLMKARRA